VEAAGNGQGESGLPARRGAEHHDKKWLAMRQVQRALQWMYDQ